MFRSVFSFSLVLVWPLVAIAQLNVILDGPQPFGYTVTDGTTVFGVAARTLYTFQTDGSEVTSMPVSLARASDLFGSVGLAEDTLLVSGGSGGLTTLKTDGTVVAEIFDINEQSPSRYHPLVIGDRIYGNAWPIQEDSPSLPAGGPSFPTAYVYSMNLDGSDAQLVGLTGGETPISTPLVTDGSTIFGSDSSQFYSVDVDTGDSQMLLDQPVFSIAVSDSHVFGFTRDSSGSTGSLIKMEKDGSNMETLHQFDEGVFAADLIHDDVDGELVGFNGNKLFQISEDGNDFEVVAEAEATFRDDLVVIGRTLYGSGGPGYYSFDLDYVSGSGDGGESGGGGVTDPNAVPEPGSAAVWICLLLTCGVKYRLGRKL